VIMHAVICVLYAICISWFCSEIFVIGLGNLVSNYTNIMTLNTEARTPCHLVVCFSTLEQVSFFLFHCCSSGRLDRIRPLLIFKWSNFTIFNYQLQPTSLLVCNMLTACFWFSRFCYSVFRI